ncbi:MAG: hypothetical protein AB1813_00420 [Verrucomicrobiota bacterium]
MKKLISKDGNSIQYSRLKPVAEEVRSRSEFFPTREHEKVPVTDPWGSYYVVRARTAAIKGTFKAELDIISFGPNKKDEDGKGDDIVLPRALGL